MNWKIIFISSLSLLLILLSVAFVKTNNQEALKAGKDTAELDKQQLNKQGLADIKNKIRLIVQESVEEEIQKEVLKEIESSNANGSTKERAKNNLNN